MMISAVAIPIVGTSGAAAASFTADDVSVTTSNDQITLTVAPSGFVEYWGLEREPSSIDVVVNVKLSSDTAWETVGSTSVTGSNFGREGTATYDFQSISLLDEASSFNSDVFVPEMHETRSTGVDIRIVATLPEVAGGGSDLVVQETASYTVAVTREPGGGGGGPPGGGGGPP